MQFISLWAIMDKIVGWSQTDSGAFMGCLETVYFSVSPGVNTGDLAEG